MGERGREWAKDICAFVGIFFRCVRLLQSPNAVKYSFLVRLPNPSTISIAIGSPFSRV